MPRYEYKVVPAPQKGLKAKGVRSAEARFSNALETLMNEMAEDGWDYQRAETLPSIERSGLASTTTEWRNVLVFRRLRETAAEAFAPELLAPPQELSDQPDPASIAEADQIPETQETAPQKEVEPTAQTSPEGPTQPRDNGVEDTDNVAGFGTSLEQHAAYRKSLKTED
jgi:hypothetical protein